jgi:hypothetical protein
MGTNYYLMTDEMEPCSECEQDKQLILHIGKSSAGWTFNLHVIPERDINSLEDWITMFKKYPTKIENECARQISVDEMIKTISVRENFNGMPLLRQSNFEDGATKGPGTWDLCLGDFS